MKALKRSQKKSFIIPIITFFLGVILIIAIERVFANSTTIYACVKTANGNVRIVTANTNCSNGETPLSWDQQGPQGPQGPTGGTWNDLPFFCNGCMLSPYADKFAGKNWSKAQIGGFSSFDHSDLTGVMLTQGILSVNFNNDNLTNADISNASAAGSSFDHTNLTNANFSNTDMSQVSMQNATIQNTNFSNVNFTNAFLQGSTGFSSANVNGATWSNTTCPDGTNSDNNGHTCVGHF